jgi:hypothetical protein
MGGKMEAPFCISIAFPCIWNSSSMGNISTVSLHVRVTNNKNLEQRRKTESTVLRGKHHIANKPAKDVK